MSRRPIVVALLFGSILVPACSHDHVTGPGPSITLSTASVSISAALGGAAPAPQAVSVTNGGNGSLHDLSAATSYSAGQPTGWLSASLSGTSAPAMLSLQAAMGAAPGSYSAVVVVSAPAADNSPQSITVQFTIAAADLVVSAPAALAATPSSVLPGGQVSLSAWSVANQGNGGTNAFSNGFYLSSDATITAADVRLDGNSNSALAPGASFDWGAPTLTIPAGTAPGSYWVGILVDDQDGTPESNEGNNYKGVAITVLAPQPDLLISAPATLLATPSSVLPGGQVSLSAWTVANQGSGVSSAFSNGFYLSNDATITAGDVRLDGNANLALGPGGSFDWGAPTLTIPAGTAPGSYYLGILVDDHNASAESNEGNNYKSVAITVLAPQPDLLISAPASLVASPPSVLPGGHVSLSAWTVANQGSGSSNNFSNGFYLSSDAVITPSDVRLDGNSNSALAPGASFNWGAPTLTIPAGTAPGTYYLGILVDENNGTPESNEGNNYKSVAITVVAPLADLVISAPASLVASPPSVLPGGHVTLSPWTVMNQGSGASNDFVNGFYLSSDAVITASDVRLDGNGNTALAPGASFSWGGPTLTIPAGTAPGTYYLGILVDETNGTPESNEGNNYKSVQITVLAPLADLVISAPASLVANPSSVLPGGQVSLSAWTVANQGSVASNAFSNGFYLSSDAVITASDVRLDGNGNTALAPGASFAWGGPTLTIPAGTAPGNYYIGILVDENNGTPESNEGNNYKSVAITVLAPIADLTISAPATLVVAPATVVRGGSVVLSAWTVKNQGTVASNAFSNGFYLSTDAVITASDLRLDGNGNFALAAGASFSWGGPTLTIPASVAPGIYYIGILVDENNGTPESNEANNYKSVALVVTASLADLVISAPASLVASPPVINAGGRVALSAWTVMNQGVVSSNAFSNGFYLSTDAVITSADVRLDGNSNFALAPGGSFAWGGPTVTIPAGTAPGNYYLGILVDENNGTPESNEANNYKSVAITVVAPLLRYPFEGNANNVGAQAGYNGSTTNATFPAGKFGLAVKFDGSATTGATFPGTGALLGSGSKWTISLWFREDVLQPTSWLFDIRVTTPGAERGWETYHGVTTGFITSCSVGGCYSFATPATAVWHNLIYRYDGASATVGAPVQIYVDGALSGEITNASLLPLIAPGVGDMLLGNVRRVPTGSGGLFYVDELRVYDAVFTIAQQCTLIIGGTWNGSSCALP